jgi:hypothetical protein
MRNFLWLGSKFIPAMYQGELMLSAASKIFSVTISTSPLSHRLLPPVAADRIAALPMKEDRSEEIKPYPPNTPLPTRISIEAEMTCANNVLPRLLGARTL